MKRKLIVYPILASLFLVCLSPPGRAQTASQDATIMIEGSVIDPSGAAVAGAKVSAIQTPGTLHYETVTDASGHYRIASPAAGTYTVAAQESGFRPATSQVTVVDGSVAKADIQLALAGLSANVVVTATSDVFGETSGIPIDKVPQSVQVLDQGDLLDMNVRSIGDALKAVPSATPGAGRESTYQAFSQKIRGFTAIQMYNGVYQRYYSNVDPSATSNIERVEVLKGPSDVLYGSGAVGGIISIITKEPQHDFSGSVSVIGGSYDQASGAFDVTGPVRGATGLYFRATGEVERSGTFINYLPENRDNGAFSANWEHSDEVAIHFVGEWEERDTLRNPGLPAIGTVVWNGVARIPSSTYLGEPAYDGNPGHSYFTATGPLIQAWADIKLNDNWMLTPRVSYSGFTGIYSEINLGAVGADNLTVARTGRYLEERHHYPNEQVNLSGTVHAFRMRHHLLMGVQNNDWLVGFFQQNISTVPSINVLNPVYTGVADGPYPVSNVTDNRYDDWAVDAQDQIDITDRLNVILGIRGDWYLGVHSTTTSYATPFTRTNDNFNHATGQAGATYRLANGWSLFGGYATGFNIENTAGALTYNGVPLAPENSWQGEAGVRHTQGAFSGSASFFQVDRTNAVTVDPNHPGYSINNGDVRARGVELEGQWRMGKSLFVEPGYAYTDAQVIKSNSGNLGFEVADTPKNRADLFLRYALPRMPLQFRAGINYVGNRAFADTANVSIGPNLLANNVILPNYTDVELGANYTYGRARLDVNVENIANKVYYTRDFTNYSVIPGEPRQVSARMTYRF